MRLDLLIIDTITAKTQTLFIYLSKTQRIGESTTLGVLRWQSIALNYRTYL